MEGVGTLDHADLGKPAGEFRRRLDVRRQRLDALREGRVGRIDRGAGPAHGRRRIDRSFEVTSRTLHAVFTELRDQRVQPEGILLKPNMVLPGYESSSQVPDDEIANETVRCFLRHVPAAVPGVVFLSGGQSEEEATRRLNAMNAIGPHPWKLSFSYGRALQATALKAWQGKEENVEAAQQGYYHRAKMNGAATTGTYVPELERETVTA